MRKNALLVTAALVGALIAAPLAVYASHRFVDVPDSHTFHNAIDWLADNGITVGCNPPDNDRFCPNVSVTRGQMAAFMKRLSDNRTPRVVAQTDSDTAPHNVSAQTEINSVDITAPVAGTLIITGSTLVTNNTFAEAAIAVFADADGAPIGHGIVVFEGFNAADFRTLSYTTATPVAAGDHNVSISASVANVSGDPIAGDFAYNANNVAVTFVPDGTVISVAAVGDSGAGLTGG